MAGKEYTAEDLEGKCVRFVYPGGRAWMAALYLEETRELISRVVRFEIRADVGAPHVYANVTLSYPSHAWGSDEDHVCKVSPIFGVKGEVS